MINNQRWSKELAVLLAIASGISVGSYFSGALLKTIMPLSLFFMLYPNMLRVELRQMKEVINKPGLMMTALLMNCLFSPLLIFALLHLFFTEQDKTVMIGLVLYGIVPCGAMVTVFTGTLRGNVTFAAAVLTLSLILSLGIVPFWSKYLLGAAVVVPLGTLFKYLAAVVGFPLLMARVTRRALIGRKGGWRFAQFRHQLEKCSTLGLILFLFIVFSLNGHQVMDNP